MSRGTHYYIEVKSKDKWELLQCFTEEHLFGGYRKFNNADLFGDWWYKTDENGWRLCSRYCQR